MSAPDTRVWTPPLGFTFDPIEHAYALNRHPMPSVTGIILENGMMDSTWWTEEGRDRGKAVHLATHAFDLKLDWELELPTDAPDIGGFMRSYALFHKEHAVDWTYLEQPVCVTGTERDGDAPRGLYYAGTLDRAGAVTGIRGVYDFKTGADEPWHGVQLVAYRDALKDPRFTLRYTIRLEKDGGRAKIEAQTNSSDATTWASALHMYHWRRINGLVRAA